MAFIYKKIVKSKGVVYYLSQAMRNSISCQVIAYANNCEAVVAKINNKKHTIEYMTPLSNIVTNIIERFYL